MVQQLIIALLFLVALFYIGRRVYQSVFVRKQGCAKGCGCSDEKAALTGKANKTTAV